MAGIFDDYFDAVPAATPSQPAAASRGGIFDDYLDVAPQQSDTRRAVAEKAQANGFGDRVSAAREQAIRGEVQANDSWDAADAIEGGIQRVKGNLARYGGEARKRAGLPMPEGYDNEAYVQEQRVRADAYREQAGFEQDWRNIDGPTKFASYAGGQLLNSAPEIAATIVNPVAGIAGALASYGGSNLDAQIEEGGETDLLAATVAGAGQAVLDRFVGVERVVGGAIKGAFKGEGIRKVGGDVAKRTLIGAASEGGQEAGQQTLEEAARYQVAADDYNVMDAAKRVGESFIGGALVGGAVNPILTKDGPTPARKPEAAGSTPAGIAGDARVDPLNMSRENQTQKPDITMDTSRLATESTGEDQNLSPIPPGRKELPDQPFMQFEPERVIKTIRGDGTLSAPVREMTLVVNDAIDTGDTRAAFERLRMMEQTFEEKALARKKPIPEKERAVFDGAISRAVALLREFDARPRTDVPPAAKPTITPPGAPTVDQMAGPGVPIEKPGQINAAQAGFNSMVRPGEDIGQMTVDAKVAQQNMMAQQQAEQQRAADLGMLEQALPAAEQIAATAEEQQALQEEDNLRIQQEQLQPAQRQELLDSIINGAKPSVTPLRAFMQGLSKIAPDAQPTPEELGALAKYSSMSYADKVAQAEKVKPEKLVPKAPQNEALLEPVSVPAKQNKRQQRAQQARAEATALVPESQQSPELKSMLKALEDTATSIDTVFKNLLSATATEPQQQSLFEGSDPRVQPSQPKSFRQYVQNKIAAQDAKFEKQLADLKATVEAQSKPAPEPKQEELFTKKGEPTKAALGLTPDQIVTKIRDTQKKMTGALAPRTMILSRLEELVGTVAPDKISMAVDALANPEVSIAEAVQAFEFAAPEARNPRPAPEAAAEVEPEAESAVLDEENPGVNPSDAALMPLSPAARVRARERGLGEALKMWTAGWKNAPEIVLFDPNNPSDPRAAEFYKFAPFAGLYDRETKKVFMNIYAFENAEQFGGTLYHEALGHYGLDQLYGKRRREVLMQIYRGNPEVRREAAALQKQSGVSVGTDIENQLYYTEEVLVNRFNNGNLELSPTFWQKIRDLITEFARKMGMPSRKYTNAELIATLHAARDTVINGRPPTAPRPTRTEFGQRFAAQPLAPARQPVGQEVINAFASSTALNSYMLKKGIVDPNIRRAAISARDFMQKSRLLTMMGNTFADYAKRLGLTDYERLNSIQQARSALINEQRVEIENLVVEANRLSNREALQVFMKDYTTKGKHGFVPDFYTAADKADVKVDPTTQAMVEEFQNKYPAEHAMMLKLMKFAYNERNTYSNAIEKYINDEASAAEQEAGLTAREIADIKDRKARQLKMFRAAVPKLDGPYFPLSRFGKIMVVAESPEFRALQAKEKRTKEENAQLEAMESDPKHYQVHFFESKGEAELERAEIAAQPTFAGEGARVTVAAKTEFFEQMGESPLLQMQKLRQMVMKDLPETSFDKDTKRQIDTLLSDLYVRSLAETSARKFDARRKNVAGASNDMLRSFHDKMKADVASRAHVTTFAQEMAIQKTLYDQINKSPTDPQYESRRDFLRELQFRNNQQLGLDMRQSELSNRVMLASSVYHLFTMPRYYIQNLLQPGVYTAPKIAARHTIGKTLSTMGDVYNVMKDAALTKEFLSGEINIDGLNLPADEKAFLKVAQQQGKLDFGAQLDFGEWNSNTKTGRGVRKAVHIMRTISGQVEFVNRTVAGVTAYRLEKARSGNGKAATDYALRMIDDTQLNYSTLAQSRLFNMLPKPVGQFRKYSVGMLALQYGMAKQMLLSARKEGLSSEEFKEASRAFAYSWGTIGAIAGVMGLPGMQTLAVMGAYMFGDDDEPVNGERWLRGKFSDDEMGLALRRGLPALMGLDMSTVGLGALLNPLPFFDYSKLENRGGATELFGAALGPAAGAVAGVIDKTYQDGVVAGAQQALPTGFRAMIKAYGMATEGLERKNGDIVMTPEEIGTMKSVLQALGFRDLDAAEKMTRYYETVAAEEYYRNQVSDLKRDFAEAQDAGNADAQREVIAQWRRMNEAKKRFDLKPTAVSELYKARKQRAERVKKFRERAAID